MPLAVLAVVGVVLKRTASIVRQVPVNIAVISGLDPVRPAQVIQRIIRIRNSRSGMSAPYAYIYRDPYAIASDIKQTQHRKIKSL